MNKCEQEPLLIIFTVCGTLITMNVMKVNHLLPVGMFNISFMLLV